MAVLLAISITTVLVISPLKAICQKKTSTQINVFPENVSKILISSCAGCHGDNGKKMAMSMWNFNKWGTYAAEKQSKKAKQICNAVTKGKMPPSSIKKSNPDEIPTAGQIDIICKWANSLNGK